MFELVYGGRISIPGLGAHLRISTQMHLHVLYILCLYASTCKSQVDAHTHIACKSMPASRCAYPYRPSRLSMSIYLTHLVSIYLSHFVRAFLSTSKSFFTLNLSVHIHVSVYTYRYIYIHIYTYISICIYMYICTYKHMCVCMYI